MLDVRGLTKEYPNRAVVDHVTFTVPPASLVESHPSSFRVLNRFWERWAAIRRKPGTDTDFRRSLPEIGCLFQGLPHAHTLRLPLPPKTVKHPASLPHRAPGAPRAMMWQRSYSLEEMKPWVLSVGRKPFSSFSSL
jgi:hypothetical protein